MKKGKTLAEHFKYHHEHPPAPFNTDFDPKADGRYTRVSKSMQEDNFYATHTLEECKVEWHKRYDELKAKGE
jgi:hypothetical protein